MGMKLKKLLPLFGVMSMGVLAPAFAECQHSGGPQSTASTQQTDQEAYQRGMYREVLPAAGPVVANGVGLFLRLEPLFYWRVVPDGTAYASHGYKTSHTTTAVHQPAPSGCVEYLDAKWSFGGKASIGVNLGHDGWDTALRYTYLRPTGKGQFRPGVEDFHASFALNAVGELIAPTGERGGVADWSLRFHVLDLELGRNSYLTPFLTVRPHIGVKATWQKDKRDICFRSVDFHLQSADKDKQAVNTPVSGPYYVNHGYDVWGVGLRVGCDCSWFFCKGFGLYSKFSGSVLWANYYDQRRVDTLRDAAHTGSSVDTAVLHFDDADYYAAKSLCELECGLVWESWLCDDDYHIEARLGCEGQVWVNWVRNLAVVSGTYSNLSCFGPKATFRVDF